MRLKTRTLTAIFLVFLLGTLKYVESANWAQVTGVKYQNANTNPETRWSPRWGHSAAALMLQRPELRGGEEEPDPLLGPEMYRGGPFPFICPHRRRAISIVEMFKLSEDDLAYEEVVRNWTDSLELVYIQDFMLGPGPGKYRFEVRAFDPAGNYDLIFEEGRNVHIWIYEPPLPVGLIVGSILGFFAIVGGVYLEVRRRKKKAAMERYAIKRMRRKFKGVQKGGKKGKGKKKKKKGGKKAAAAGDGENPEEDWRGYYDEGKGNKGKKKTKKKKLGKKDEDGKKKKKKKKNKDKDKKKKKKKSKK